MSLPPQTLKKYFFYLSHLDLDLEELLRQLGVGHGEKAKLSSNKKKRSNNGSSYLLKNLSQDTNGEWAQVRLNNSEFSVTGSL